MLLQLQQEKLLLCFFWENTPGGGIGSVKLGYGSGCGRVERMDYIILIIYFLLFSLYHKLSYESSTIHYIMKKNLFSLETSDLAKIYIFTPPEARLIDHKPLALENLHSKKKWLQHQIAFPKIHFNDENY